MIGRRIGRRVGCGCRRLLGCRLPMKLGKHRIETGRLVATDLLRLDHLALTCFRNASGKLLRIRQRLEVRCRGRLAWRGRITEKRRRCVLIEEVRLKPFVPILKLHAQVKVLLLGLGLLIPLGNVRCGSAAELVPGHVGCIVVERTLRWRPLIGQRELRSLIGYRILRVHRRGRRRQCIGRRIWVDMRFRKRAKTKSHEPARNRALRAGLKHIHGALTNS